MRAVSLGRAEPQSYRGQIAGRAQDVDRQPAGKPSAIRECLLAVFPAIP